MVTEISVSIEFAVENDIAIYTVNDAIILTDVISTNLKLTEGFNQDENSQKAHK